MPRSAQAHFIWLATGEDGQLHVYFSESAEPDDPELLKYAEKAKVFRLKREGAAESLMLSRTKDGLIANLEGRRAGIRSSWPPSISA